MRRAFTLLICVVLVMSACGDDDTSATSEAVEGSVVVPNVVGESAAFASGVLEATGLGATVIEEAIEGAEAGTVVEQIPAAGRTADAGATVVLRVAAGSAETTTTTAAGTATTAAGGGATTTTAASGGGGGGGGTTTTTTAPTTTTTGAPTAPDDGGDGSGSPEYSIDVPFDGTAVVHSDAISVPGDRGDGIRIEVTDMNQGDAGDLIVTFSCEPGGPRVDDDFGYSGGSACDTTFNTTEFVGYQSNLQSFWIYVPDGVEGYFTYTVTLVAIDS